jgi:hypothetical protein
MILQSFLDKSLSNVWTCVTRELLMLTGKKVYSSAISLEEPG